MSQTTIVTDWSTKPSTDRIVVLPPYVGRWAHRGPEHLSECLLFTAPDLYCTCDDDSPDWTI